MDGVTEGEDVLEALTDRLLVTDVEGVRDGEAVGVELSDTDGVMLGVMEMVGVTLGVMETVGVREGDVVGVEDMEGLPEGEGEGDGATFTLRAASITQSPVNSLSWCTSTARVTCPVPLVSEDAREARLKGKVTTLGFTTLEAAATFMPTAPAFMFQRRTSTPFKYTTAPSSTYRSKDAVPVALRPRATFTVRR